MILQRLREETRHHHEQMEGALNLLDPHLTTASYTDQLLRFWGFYHPLEERLMAVHKQTPLTDDYPTRMKSPRLAEDLRHLGLSDEAINAAPVAQDLPEIHDRAEALGALYVLEGSTLGGQLIYKHLQKTLGEEATGSASFFNPYGEQTGSMWKQFQQVLTEAATSPDVEDHMVQAASNTFSGLHQWMSTRNLAKHPIPSK